MLVTKPLFISMVHVSSGPLNNTIRYNVWFHQCISKCWNVY